MHRRLFQGLPAAFALLLAMSIGSPKTALCQTAGSATITGTVTDPSGSVVPGAAVTIHNTDTGIERKTQTSDAGIYTAAFLAPGHYQIEASKQGFTAVLRKDLTLQVGQTLSIDLAMAVQSTQAEVTVTGESPVVDTEKTEVSQVVSQAAVDNLPVSGRRWDTFVRTSLPTVPAAWFPTAEFPVSTIPTLSTAPTTIRRYSRKRAAAR